MPASYLKQPYIPARLHKGKLHGKDRWCIKFYQTDPKTGKRERFMPTFEMNRIKSKRERLKFAAAKVKELNKLLPYGFPFKNIKIEEVKLLEQQEQNKNPLHDTNIVDAILIAAKFRKARTNNKKSKQMHDSRAKLFIDYLELKGLTKKKIIQFGRREAKQYLNYNMIEKDLTNTTFNNTLSQIRRLFKELKANEYILENPFEDQEALPPSPKRRREILPSERHIILKYLHENNRRLYYAFLFEYVCLIRPGALREMKFSWIKINEGIVQVPFDGNKSKRWKNTTIPKSILKELIDDNFFKYPGHYYVFGYKLRPHATRQCGINTLNRYFKNTLKLLEKAGELGDMRNVSFYSGKDAGITDLSERVGLLDVQMQAGHTDPKVTMKYYHQKRKIKSIEALNLDIKKD